jgi:hypothetical protein
VVTPQDLDSEVIKGLRDAAKRGSAPAARELREWLARNPTAVDVETLHHKPPEELDPAELEELRAWALQSYWAARGEEEGEVDRSQAEANGLVEPGREAGGHPREEWDSGAVDVRWHRHRPAWREQRDWLREHGPELLAFRPLN